MNTNFERYHCQMALPQFGERAQLLLQHAKILVVGAGGLGCPAAQYLAAAGVGTIAIADDDIISIRNLHRQILFNPNEVGLKKVTVACERLQQLNPVIKIIPYDLRITAVNVMNLISSYDFIIEGTDNFETKCLLNDACVLSGKPLVYGAIYQYEGQVATWNVRNDDGTYSPNYRDVFPDAEKTYVPDCSEGGVIPTLAGIVGCMQANEAIKFITKDKNLLIGKLWMFNSQAGETRIINLGTTSHTKINELPETIPIITYEDLKKGLAQNIYNLIDVRSEVAHHVFNIGGENFPLENLEEQMVNFTFSKPIIFYCSTGKRSSTAVKMIKGKFPKAEIYSLKGGVMNIKKI